VCGACGQEKVVIGYESAEQLDVEPAKYFVRTAMARLILLHWAVRCPLTLTGLPLVALNGLMPSVAFILPTLAGVLCFCLFERKQAHYKGWSVEREA
jgi:hypothetical protein